MCKLEMTVLASVLAVLLLLGALPASASAGLAGWQYQREITIQENSGETLRDYQVLVELAGSDFPGEAQPDGDDIRFTDADGRELSYWIEEFDAGSKRATIWVKVPEIPANGEAGITMWYGNPGAESESDGEAVFEFFDDFESGKLDKWKIRSGDWSIKNGELAGKGTKSSRDTLTTVQEFTIDRAVEVDVKHITLGNHLISGIILGNTNPSDGANGGNDGVRILFFDRGDHMRLDIGEALESKYKTTIKAQTGTWNHIKYQRLEKNKGTNYEVWVNEELKFDVTESLDTSTWNHLGLWVYQNGYAHFDNIHVRKYSSSEPTITIAPPAPATHTTLTITKSPTPHSIRQFQETTITISIENLGTTDATDIEITDAIHPSFDLISGDFPNPKRYDLIRPGETRDLQYTITAKESGTFTLDHATVTYADGDGNIQEAKSEPTSIKVIPSTDGSTSGTFHNPSLSTASVQLHGEKTDVVLGEDILFKLSAVNLITKPTMHVQVIIIPPSGMSVTSSAFAKSGAGQYTTTYELEPGSGKDIEVAIRSNQVGDFNVNGRIIYYFGDDREHAEDHTLNLPIMVRAEADAGAERAAGTSESEGSSAPGFGVVVAGMILFAIYLRRKRA